MSSSNEPDEDRPAGPIFNKSYFCSAQGFLSCVESVSRLKSTGSFAVLYSTVCLKTERNSMSHVSTPQPWGLAGGGGGREETYDISDQ